MTLALPAQWVWDFWFAEEDDRYHVFYLQAPKSLGDPDLRHRNATIGHAASTDLIAWETLPDALHPGERCAWDDVATWTGSVIQHSGRWYMFYTGTSWYEDGRVQRIGLATSGDLVTWHKHGDQSLIEADTRWYETIGTGDWPEEAWRDPWVFEVDGTFHALITARANHGPSDGRGVIGHAVSHDLLNWEVRPPLSEPGEFAHLEVPQLADVGGDHVLVFSCDRARVSNRRRARFGDVSGGVYTVSTSNPLGPYDIGAATQALPTGHFSGRLIRRRDDTWVWLAFLDETSDRDFVGELIDPVVYPWPPQERPGP